MPSSSRILRFTPLLKPAFWMMLGLMTISVFLYTELPFADFRNPDHERHVRMGAALGLHALLGTIAIGAGPLQFSRRIRQRFPLAHRGVGIAYVLSVLAAAPLGVEMAAVVQSPLLFATCIQAATWFLTTLAAYVTACNRHYAAHRQWMIRSYAVTFTFILLRVPNPWPVWKKMPEDTYSLVMMLVTFLCILIPDLVFQWPQISRRRA